MTPAVEAAKRAQIEFELHQYKHDTAADSWGMEAAEKLGVAPERVFKTLVIRLGTEASAELAVCIIPVNARLNLKKAAKAAKTKRAEMAEAPRVERTTGYVLGGVSPLGQKKRLPTLLDKTAAGQNTLFVSAGRRGMDLELSPADLLQLTNGTYADLQQE